MRMYLLTILIAVLSVSAFAQSKSIQGVWKIDEVTMTGMDGKTMNMKATQPSMYLFTKTHYSIIYVESDKPREVMDD